MEKKKVSTVLKTILAVVTLEYFSELAIQFLFEKIFFKTGLFITNVIFKGNIDPNEIDDKKQERMEQLGLVVLLAPVSISIIISGLVKLG